MRYNLQGNGRHEGRSLNCKRATAKPHYDQAKYFPTLFLIGLKSQVGFEFIRIKTLTKEKIMTSKNLTHRPQAIAAKIILPILALGLLTNCASTGYSAPVSYGKTNNDYSRYNGYCFQSNNTNTRTKGTVIGAVAGGVLGNQVAGSGNRTEGTILGAVIGGVIGSQVGGQMEETDKSNCMNNDYYLFNRGYYQPSEPPQGYRIAYFYQKPAGLRYHNDNSRR